MDEGVFLLGLLHLTGQDDDVVTGPLLLIDQYVKPPSGTPLIDASDDVDYPHLRHPSMGPGY